MHLQLGMQALCVHQSRTGPGLPAPGAEQAANGRAPGCQCTLGLSAHAEWTVSFALLLISKRIASQNHYSTDCPTRLLEGLGILCDVDRRIGGH